MSGVTKAINYAKAISAETITNAKSGHTGVSLGAATILFALFRDHLHFDASDTDYLNRDRFILSAGHASALYYTLLSMFGFNISLQDLKEYRTLGSKTPGHPEFGKTDGVEITTGALGQGVANAVGMAIAETVMEERFNKEKFEIFSHKTYCFVSDGDLMEGVAQEAASLAGTLNLKNLILLYDSNGVTMDGVSEISNRENVAKKFAAMGWNVIRVINGNSYSLCTHAIAKARKSNKPTIIIFKTLIGVGTEKEGTSSMHSAVLSQKELALLKAELDVKESFFIPSDVRELCMASTRRGRLEHEQWNQLLAMYSSTHPQLYKSFISFFDRKKVNFDRILRNIAKFESKGIREINQQVLSELAYQCPQLLGGCADVAESTKAIVTNVGSFSAGNRRGKNIRFGVREHCMCAVMNGIAMYDDFLCYDSTFLAFSNYAIPALRMRAIMQIPVLSFFTHDSIAIGADGVTHQPIEQIGQLRSIIGNTVFRPCDSRELVAGYRICVTEQRPVCFVLAKQSIDDVHGSSYDGALCGGYVLSGNPQKSEVILVSSGSEVSLASKAVKELHKKHTVSMVSMPSIEVFERQSATYKNKVIPKNAPLVVAVEASNDTKWLKVLGANAVLFGIEEYQGSGSGDEVYQNAGFTVKNLVKFVENCLKTKK